MKGQNVKVLLVEDNPADAELTAEKLKQSKILVDLTVAMDGEEALDFLHKRGKFSEATTPDLVLLDLNIPKRSGLEVLEEIKETEALRRIPVVILTSSEAETDIAKSYDLHASSYVTKPVDLAGFSQIVNSIEQCWFTLVKFPSDA